MKHEPFADRHRLPHERGDQRTAARYFSLIRAAKLVTSAGEFVCVVRDVSQTGIKLRTFHPLPLAVEPFAVELQNGDRFGLRLVRRTEGGASFVFTQPVILERLIREHWTHPKRPLRVAVTVPVDLRAGGDRAAATITNLSQQGARVNTQARLATEQVVTIAGPFTGEIRAKVRWHKAATYGLVFEDTFALDAFAQLTARVQLGS